MNIGNYHPISILPVISKIYEKLIDKRLMNFFDKHNIIHKHQFVFQDGKSTEHSILDIYTSIIVALAKDKTRCIFSDFTKAFDNVNHDILLSNLGNHEIRGISLKLLRWYLLQRINLFKSGENYSSPKYITCGILKGRVLEPFLFLICINDLHHSDKNTQFNLFADDTALFHSSKTIEQLEININIALKNISNWLKANKFSLNVTNLNCSFDITINSSKQMQ